MYFFESVCPFFFIPKLAAPVSLQHPSLLHFTSAVVNSMKQTHFSAIPASLSLCVTFSPLLAHTPYPSFTHLPHSSTFPLPSRFHFHRIWRPFTARPLRPNTAAPGANFPAPTRTNSPTTPQPCGQERPAAVLCVHLCCALVRVHLFMRHNVKIWDYEERKTPHCYVCGIFAFGIPPLAFVSKSILRV